MYALETLSQLITFDFDSQVSKTPSWARSWANFSLL
jgi:hypothetical protein